MDMQRFLIGLGLAILIAGIAWPLISRIGLGATLRSSAAIRAFTFRW